MNWVRSLSAAVVIVALTTANARAASDLVIRKVTPKPGAVQVQGAYQVALGHTIIEISVQVRPADGAGGEGGHDTARTTKSTFRATVAVPAGKYEVQAILKALDSSGNEYAYCSATTTVTVPR